MTRRGLLAHDVKALGWQFPLRAVYETGKRSGAHGVLLRTLVARTHPVPLDALPCFAARPDVPDAAAQRCLEDASLILSQGHRAFGRRFIVEHPDDWNQLDERGRRWPADLHWWDIDIRTEKRLGDVKWTWELGRHRDLVILARAATLEPGGEWREALIDKLRTWLLNTPAERSVHWYSNLEISLRVIAWMQIVALQANSLPPDLLAGMALQVAQARRHLLVDFPYTASSMRNNHLLGDALGLIAIERFTGSRAGPLTRIGERAFKSQLERHMHLDGSMIEDSVSYHRFVLEMLAVKRLLGDRSAGTSAALLAAGEHLERVGVFEGELPQWGDWDEGRVLASSGDTHDLGGSAALALTLAGDCRSNEWRDRYDEIAWYSPAVPTQRPRPRTRSTSLSGGLARVKRSDWTMWFKCGTGPSHQHADLTHISLRFGDRWVLVDPGTGSYNGRADVRNGFRTGQAHNGLQIPGEEMFVPHRAFRWLTTAMAAQGPEIVTPTATIVWGVHDAFRRLPGGGRMARAVLVTDEGVTSVDWRESHGFQQARVTVPLPPGASVEDDELRFPGFEMDEGRRFALIGLEDATVSMGQDHPFQGWHSHTYGDIAPSPWLVKNFDRTGPIWWGIARVGTAAKLPKIEGNGIIHSGIRLEVHFTPGGARLDVLTIGDSNIRSAFVGEQR